MSHSSSVLLPCLLLRPSCEVAFTESKMNRYTCMHMQPQSYKVSLYVYMYMHAHAHVCIYTCLCYFLFKPCVCFCTLSLLLLSKDLLLLIAVGGLMTSYMCPPASCAWRADALSPLHGDGRRTGSRVSPSYMGLLNLLSVMLWLVIVAFGVLGIL